MSDQNPKKAHRRKRRKYGTKFIIILAVLLVLAAGGASAVFFSLFGANFREEQLTQEQINSVIDLGEEDPDLLGESSAPLDGEISGDLVKKQGAYTFIVGGSSNGFINTDTLMLVYFEPAAGKLNILQIPRDTYVESTGGKSKKINAAYAYGRGDGLKKTIAQTFGIAVDNYVVISTKAFREVVDAVGGVTVDVPIDMDYEDPAQDLYIHLKKGTQTLDGDKAEQFVRFRKGYATQDLGRMNAQKTFLAAFAKKLFSIDGVTKIPGLVGTVFENMKTDMSVADMIGYATKCFDLDTANIAFYSLPGESYKNGLYISMYRAETLELLNAAFNPYTRPLTDEDISIKELSRIEAEHYKPQHATVDEISGDAPKSTGGAAAAPTSSSSAAPEGAAKSGEQPDGGAGSAEAGKTGGKIYLRYCGDYSQVEGLVANLRELGFAVETRALAIHYGATSIYYREPAAKLEQVKALLPSATCEADAEQADYDYEIYIGANYAP